MNEWELGVGGGVGGLRVGLGRKRPKIQTECLGDGCDDVAE